MKRIKLFVSYFLITLTVFTSTGCFGSFGLVKAVYDFNDGLSENKFIKSLMMIVLLVIPVYEISALLDIILFNLIEFWSGSNPVSMKDGEIETQYATVGGNDFYYEVSKNQYKITQLTGKQKGLIRIMRYNPEEKTWYFKGGDSAEKPVMTFLDGVGTDEMIRVYSKRGYVDLNTGHNYSSIEMARLFQFADEKFISVNNR